MPELPGSPDREGTVIEKGAPMDRFADFLRRQVDIDLELLRTMREDVEVGKADHPYLPTVYRGFRECELKTRLLRLHQDCGSGSGSCDALEQTYPPDDERGCPTRAILGVPYSDRPGYQDRWRP